MLYMIIVIGLFFIYLFMRERIQKHMVTSVLCKGIASTSFFMLGLYGVYLSDIQTSLPYFLLVGLFFGVLGDIWLGLKWSFSKTERLFTLAGFICFGLGHLFYLVAMLYNYAYTVPISYFFIGVSVSILLALIVIFGNQMRGMRYRGFRQIALLYSIFLIFFCISSGILMVVNQFSIGLINRMFAGSLFFLISDYTLSWTYFSKGHNRPIDVIVTHVTYYLAQYLIAFAIFAL